MKFFVLIFFVFVSVFCFGQKDTNWYAFYNQDSTKIGFKDSEGNIKIKAKLEPHLTEQIFRNVIIVSEQVSDKKLKNYYLNKEGKEFGIDSIYIFDFEYAKEYEGKIKFRDYKTDKVGFFDINGKIVIPAIYNDAGDFSNELAIIYKDGKRWCYDNNTESRTNCEHYGWKDSKTVIINSKNKELFEIAEQKDYSYTIDYSQFKINEKVDPEIYTSYQATDGNTYSFYSPEKDFNKWFETIFLPDFKKNKTVLSKYFYELISVDDNDNPKENTAWKNHKRNVYLKKKQKNIDDVFNKLILGIYQKSVSWETLSNYSYFPENELPKEDLKNKTVISFLARPENDFSTTNSFQFTKIGDEFYITSAP